MTAPLRTSSASAQKPPRLSQLPTLRSPKLMGIWFFHFGVRIDERDGRIAFCAVQTSEIVEIPQEL